MIAGRMMASLQSTAQLTYHGDADVTHLMALRKGWKADGLNISLEACLIHALCRTLEGFPAFNGVADEVSVTMAGDVDLSLAISTPSGLMTPVLKGANALPLAELSDTRRALVSRALAGELAVSEMKGGTFTLSNLGHTRVRYFTPILNAGQIALLGVGRLEQTAVFNDEGEVTASYRLPLSLTADHRIVDGEPAGKFLDTLCCKLEGFDAGE